MVFVLSIIVKGMRDSNIDNRVKMNQKQQKRPMYERSTSVILPWLGIKNDYRTLIGVDSLNIIEVEDDEEDGENSDV